MELPEMRPPYVQSGSELLTTLDTLQRAISTAQTYRLQLLARLDETGHATDLGARDTTDLISVRHRLNRTDVKRDLTLAKDLTKYPDRHRRPPRPVHRPRRPRPGPRRHRLRRPRRRRPRRPGPDDTDDLDLDLAVDPEDTDADADDTDADADGDSGPVVLNLAQAAAIITALNKVPKTVPVENLQVAEDNMVEAARHLLPRDLDILGQQVINTLDTDGAEPAEDAAYQREKLWLQRADHGIKFGGFLAAENAELFQAAIDRLAKPHKTVEGELDPRPRDKRQADALVMILEAAAGNPDATPGVPHLMVTIDFEDLKNATSQALGDLMFSGATLSAAAVRRLACDAAILPIVLGSNSQALDVGTEQRFVNRAMRRALIKRDKGCVICQAPPPYCHAHHIIHWIDGGPTSLDNLALFCGGHHHAIHKGHYTVTITNGVVHVTRPEWADPPEANPPHPPQPARPHVRHAGTGNPAPHPGTHHRIHYRPCNSGHRRRHHRHPVLAHPRSRSPPQPLGRRQQRSPRPLVPRRWRPPRQLSSRGSSCELRSRRHASPKPRARPGRSSDGLISHAVVWGARFGPDSNPANDHREQTPDPYGRRWL